MNYKMDSYILDSNFNVIGIADTFISFIWTDRYNKTGDFEIYTAIDADLLSKARAGSYLYLKDTDHMMIIEDISIDTDSETGDKLSITGRSLESILGRRVIFSQITLSGNFQNAIKRLITNAIISPSDSKRRIPNFIFQDSTDTRITSLTLEETQIEGENLLDVIETLCSNYDVGFKVTLNASNQFIFSLYAGEDRSYNQTANSYVIYSPEFDNFMSSNYFESDADYKSYVFVIGAEDSETKIKPTVTVGDLTATGLDRRELYLDSSISRTDDEGVEIPLGRYNEMLRTKGTEELKNYEKVAMFEGEADATHMFIINEDVFLGDIVQTKDKYGLEAPSRIGEVVYSYNTGGITVVPTFTAVHSA